MIPGSYGTATPEVGKSLEAADDAFGRIETLRAAQEAKKAAKAAGLNDYSPEIDGVWDRDQAEIVGDLKGYREKSLDFFQDDQDINDPSNRDAYGWNMNTQSAIDSKIAKTAQHKEYWEKGMEALSGKDAAAAYEPESWIRLNEFYTAPTIDDRQKVLEKYKGELLLPISFDMGAYAKGIVPKPTESFEVGPSGIPGVRKETTTKAVTDDQLVGTVRSQMSMASAGNFPAQKFMEGVNKAIEALDEPTRKAFQEEAEKAGVNEIEFHGMRLLRPYAPREQLKGTTKNNPVPRSSGGGVQLSFGDRAKLAQAERLVLTVANAFNRDGEQWQPLGTASASSGGQEGRLVKDAAGNWVSVPPNVGAIVSPMGPSAVPAPASQPRFFPVGLPMGKFQVQETVVEGTGASRREVLTQRSLDNTLQGFYEIDGQLFIRTTESMGTGKGITKTIPGAGAINGLVKVTGDDLDMVLRQLANGSGEVKQADIEAFVNQKGRYADPNDSRINWSAYRRDGGWWSGGDEGGASSLPANW